MSFCALFLSVSKCAGEGTVGRSEVGHDRRGSDCSDGGTACRPRTSFLARDSMILLSDVHTAQILFLIRFLIFAIEVSF